MRIKYRDKIIYNESTSTTLETEDKFLTDNLTIENNENSTISISYGENNEITTINE